jgi:hypothetical protein
VEVAGRWRDGVVRTGSWGGRVGAVEVGAVEVGAVEVGAGDVVPGAGVAGDVPVGAVGAGAASGPIGGPGAWDTTRIATDVLIIAAIAASSARTVLAADGLPITATPGVRSG